MNSARRETLLRAVAQHGQAAVARAIGRSPSAVNQVLHGTYQGSPDAILEAVAEAYGNERVACPVLGDIPLVQCNDERRRTEFRPTSEIRVRLWEACKACGNNPRIPVQTPPPGARSVPPPAAGGAR